MKILLLLLFIQTSHAQWFYGSGEAVNLEQQIGFNATPEPKLRSDTSSLMIFNSNESTPTANTSSLFEVFSVLQGSRPCPSMNTTQRDAIATPATGLCIFSTTNSRYEFYTGATWSAFSGGVLALSDLSDVLVTAPSAGQFLTYDAGDARFENVTIPIFPVSVTAQAVTFAPANKVLYIINVTGGAISINLPAPSAGFMFSFKVIGNAATNNVTLVRNAAESIEGTAANYVIDNELGAFTVVSDGTDWFLI